MRASAAAPLGCLAALLGGCSLALDFGPGALLAPLDAGRAADAPDATAVDAPAADAPTADAPDARCPAPMVECGGACVDLRRDARHCGACGSACGPGAQRCCAGTCINGPPCE